MTTQGLSLVKLNDEIHVKSTRHEYSALKMDMDGGPYTTQTT